MKFVRNTWYAAGWSEDIGRSLLPRTLLNEQILFYRKEDGTPCAIRDRCPHRFAPLSLGKLIGDEVECLYHGLRFNCDGRCTDNPNGHGVIPSAAQVRSYPLAERWGLVWIWMGDAALADPASIPDLPWLTDTQRFTAAHGTIKINASYLLVLDNLTDLTHGAFVHADTLAPRELARNVFKITEQDGQVWTRVLAPNVPVPKFFTLVKGFTGQMDLWLDMRCDPPGTMVTFYGVTEHGKSREEGWGTHNPNIITPETDRTTHYFWAAVRDFDLDDEALTQATREGAAYAFEHEDRPVLEAQQAALGDADLMDLRPVLLPNDAASARARRIIQKRIQAEERAAESPSTP